jgi:hypothetical protein
MRRLAEDMARWEAGDLLLADVVVRHPDAGVHGLAELHSELSVLLDEDPGIASGPLWATVLARLDAPVNPLYSRFRRRLVRPLVAAAAAVLLLGGIAFASGVEVVRQRVDRVVRVVTGIFDDDRNDIRGPQEPAGGNDRREGAGASGSDDDRDDTDAGDDRSEPHRGPGGDDPEEGREEDRSDEPDGGEGGGGDDEAEPDEPDDDDSGSESSGSGHEPNEPDESEEPDEEEDVAEHSPTEDADDD